MKQMSLSSSGFEKYSRATKRSVFLAEMDRVVPWSALCELVEPVYPKNEVGRPPVGLERMLRIHFLQAWFNRSDPAVEEALYDSEAMRQFVGIDLGVERAPDETTICKFRHLLTKNQLGKKVFARVNEHLKTSGMKLSTGTIVDATIISAPSSTKNRDGKRDPEMHQTKKGNQWYFGMKAHIGVDSRTKLIHSVEATAANVHDARVLPDLLHGEERRVYGDQAYRGQKNLLEIHAPKAKDFTNRRYRYQGIVDEVERMKNHYSGLKSLVAFSGTVDDGGQEFTETGLNGFDESKTPENFATGEYQVLIVAEKYQTGFDQPLLHTMYVDKVLGGIQAVQTLSRLNRCHPDKKDTCVVDFVNDRLTIYEAFKPYYDVTRIEETTNPNHVYTQQTEILQYGLIRDEEIRGFADVYFQKKPDTGRLDALVRAVVKRFSEALGPQCPKKAQESGEAFKASIRSFLRLYEFVTQLVRFVDVDLEKFYLFVKHLLPALPYAGTGENDDLTHEIELRQYRAEYLASTEIQLDDGKEAEPLPNPSTGGTGGGKTEPLMAPLSQIIEEFNARFGLNFGEADIRWMHDVEAETEADLVLVQQAKNSGEQDFKIAYDEKALDLLIDKRERDEDLFNLLVGNNDARSFLFDKMRGAFMRRVLADIVKPDGT